MRNHRIIIRNVVEGPLTASSMAKGRSSCDAWSSSCSCPWRHGTGPDHLCAPDTDADVDPDPDPRPCPTVGLLDPTGGVERPCILRTEQYQKQIPPPQIII